MAVMRNSIIFGGVDSADYGIYIGGEGTFNAPKRDVEMISIPGRNGAFALDKGRFENIEVTYSAFNYETDLATFAQNLSDFRNAICSQKGYQRLTDTFHTDEYRMAAYISGLEIKPIDYNTASKFDIVFDCKPQRYLMSGESAIDVSSGDTILNPTLFEARPMLEVEGYGNININDDTITIADVTYGNIVVRAAKQYSGIIRTANASFTATHKITVTKLNQGDTINVGQISCEATLKKLDGYNIQPMEVGTKSNATGGSNNLGTIRQIKTTDIQFSYGTSDSITSYVTFVEKMKDSGGVTQWENAKMQLVTSYDGAQTITAVLTVVSHTSMGYSTSKDVTVTFKDITADSTKSAIEGVAYIDLDIGEAWNESNGEAASLNNVVSIPAILPVLKPGANEITYDNTVTDLKLLPRWWKV